MTKILGLGMILLAFAGVADAQEGSPMGACGDEKVQFDVSQGAKMQDVKAPAAGKAQLYFIEVGNLHDTHRFGRPTIRQGMDGVWLGATQGFGYVRTDVEPGTHHLCSQWQSHFTQLTDQVSLNNFTAEAGKTYYFRLQITFQGGGADTVGPPVVDLQPVSEDEGRFLVGRAVESVSRVK